MTEQSPGVRQFRWWFVDDSIGGDWSDWHTYRAAHCPGCCHGGPRDGEHLQGAAYYDEDVLDWGAHNHFDPDDPEEWVKVEWRDAAP